jgi:hypothetical protein
VILYIVNAGVVLVDVNVSITLDVAHIGLAVVTDADGTRITVTDLLADVVPQDPPEVVSVKVTGEPEDADAVYVVVLGVVPPLLVNVPPAPPSDHNADVAPPP